LLALVGRGVANGNVYNIYDVRDSMRPRLLCQLSGVLGVHFLSATELGYLKRSAEAPGSTNTLIRLDLATHTMRTMVTVQQPIDDFSWSTDRSAVAFRLQDQVFVRHGNSAPIAVTLPPMAGLGQDFAGYNFQQAVRLSSDGRYLSVVDTRTGRLQVFDATTGAAIWGATPGTAFDIRTMAIWARDGHRLYWRDNAGVHRWDPPNAVTTLVPGLIWYDPAVSADGRSVVYTLRGEQTFIPHVEVMDLQTGQRQSASETLRAGAIFASSSTIWYGGETFTPNQLPQSSRTGQLFSYNLASRQETVLPLTAGDWLELEPGT
jgi:Tol biopolymer transport system component